MDFNLLFFISFILFFIGLFGILLQNNLLIILLCLELIIIACAINFIFISKSLTDSTGQIFVLLLFAISATEIAIGLGLLIRIYQLNFLSNSTNILSFNKFRY